MLCEHYHRVVDDDDEEEEEEEEDEAKRSTERSARCDIRGRIHRRFNTFQGRSNEIDAAVRFSARVSSSHQAEGGRDSCLHCCCYACSRYPSEGIVQYTVVHVYCKHRALE